MARLCRDGGREWVKLHKNATFSLPQFRYAQQLPRQREPNETPTFAKELFFSLISLFRSTVYDERIRCVKKLFTEITYSLLENRPVK